MAEKKKLNRYLEAGVDIDAGNRFIELIKPIVSKTFKSGVITDIGGFAGLFSLKFQDIENPVLVASTDGVGTKLKIAFMMDKHDTVGIGVLPRQSQLTCKKAVAIDPAELRQETILDHHDLFGAHHLGGTHRP